jgi:hypothetical protein
MVDFFLLIPYTQSVTDFCNGLSIGDHSGGGATSMVGEGGIVIEHLVGRPAYGCGWLLALLESVKVTSPDREQYPSLAEFPARFLEPLLTKPQARLIVAQVNLLQGHIGDLPPHLSSEEQAQFWQGYFHHLGTVDHVLRVALEDYRQVVALLPPHHLSLTICQRALCLPHQRLTGVAYQLGDNSSKPLRIQVDSVVEQVAKSAHVKLQTLLRAAVHEEAMIRLELTLVYYIKFDTFWQNSPDWYAGPFASREQANNALHQAVDHPESQIVQASEKGGFIDVRNAIRVSHVMSREEALEDGLREAGQRGYNIVPSLPFSRNALLALLQEDRNHENS